MTPFIATEDGVEVAIIVLRGIVRVVDAEDGLHYLVVDVPLPWQLDGKEEGIPSHTRAIGDGVIAGFEAEQAVSFAQPLHP